MKEEKLIRKKNKNLRGSVLLTVVAVMMVMIVFVLATLTIAGAANKRAYASYSKNQTTYTAQSAIDATIEAMVNDVNIAKNINALASASSVGSQKTLTVSGDQSLGSTTVTATNVGPVTQLDETTGKNAPTRYIIELAATTTLGDETSTVSSYYIVDPVKNTTKKVTKNNNASNGITIMGALDGLAFQFNTYGGSSIGVGKDASRWISVDESTNIPNSADYKSYSYLNDHGKTASGFSINGDLNFTTSGNYEFSENEGVRAFGNIHIGNPTNFISKADTTDYNSLPYIFAERNMSLGSQVHIGNGDVNRPWIVYCGGALDFSQTSFDVIGDIYIYDHDFSVEKQDYSDYNEANTLNATSKFGTSANSSLLSWASSLVFGGEHNVGGNLYTKGSLNLQQTSIGNDCYVKGNLKVSGLPTTIKGDLCVEGNIDCGTSLIVEGNVYCGGTVTGTIKKSDGTEITDLKNNANKFDFPADRYTLDSIMKMTTSDTTGANFIETQPVEASHYLDNEGEYIYPTQIPDNYLSAVNGTVYSNSSYTEYSWVEDPNGNYIKEIWWDGSVHYRAKYWPGETSPDGTYYSQGEVISSVEALPSVVTGNCTISGSFNRDIYINPGNDEIWIKLDNVTLSNHDIVVDNSGTGRVNFYVPENGYFKVENQGNVWTTSAKADCYKHIELKSKYKDNDADASQMIPNIYFYSGKNAEITPGGWNKGFVSAYIYAPYAKVNIPAKGIQNPSKFIDSYDVWNANRDANDKIEQSVYDTLYQDAQKYDVNGGNLCVVGAIVANDLTIQNSGNGANVFFVDNTLAHAKSDDDDDDDADDEDDEDIIEVADNTKIQIISSYSNGSYNS